MKRYKKAYIEITNICNLNCSFCPKTLRKPCYMSLDEFKFILKQVGECADYINLHQMGEPLLHKDLPEFLNFAKEQNIKINITTNGTLLSKNITKIFNNNKLNKISISLHSYEANKENISYQNYINNILEFIDELTKENKTYCAMRLWNTKNTKNNTLNSQIIEMLENHFKIDIKSKLDEFKNITLSKNIFLQLDEAFEWPDATIEDINENGFCYGLRDHFSVLCDGTVVPCCLDNNGEIKLGNIFTTPLKEILQSQRAKNIYNQFSNRKIAENLCKKCDYIKKFSKKS